MRNEKQKNQNRRPGLSPKLQQYVHGKKILPSIKSKDGEELPRFWYLDAKSCEERNTKLIEYSHQREECYKVGKFNYTLISNLRYWSTTPDRETVELAISDKYRDTNKPATNFNSEMNRICLPRHVPDCRWDRYDYFGTNDDDECDDCFAYSKRDKTKHEPVISTSSEHVDIPVDYELDNVVDPDEMDQFLMN